VMEFREKLILRSLIFQKCSEGSDVNGPDRTDLDGYPRNLAGSRWILDNPMDVYFYPFILTSFLRFLDGLETMYEFPRW
jgi:hypothetical protein